MRSTLNAGCAMLALWAGSLSAASTDPIPYRNVSPMAQIVGLPRFRGGEVLEQGAARMRLITETANDFSSGGSLTADAVSLDGETSVFTAELGVGLLDGLELAVEVPYVIHSGGGMDWLIDGFHRLTRADDNGRTDFDRNQLAYLLVLDGQPVLDLQSRTSGIGDVQVSIGARLSAGERALAVRGGVSLPTGDDEELLGSNSTEASLSMAYTDSTTLPFNLVLSAQGGLLWSEGDALGGRQKDSVYFGGLGLVYPLEKWSIKGQVTGHTRLYESSVSHLGDYGLQGAIGVGLRFSDRFEIEGSVIEDLKRRSTVDVTFQFVLTSRF